MLRRALAIAYCNRGFALTEKLELDKALADLEQAIKIDPKYGCSFSNRGRVFALKGNLIDMAVAFVMGAAFVKLSTAFIEDLIMPLVGKISGGIDFTNKFVPLSDAVTATNLADAKKQGAVIAYGDFITIGINFVIIAFVVWRISKLFEKPAAPPLSVRTCQFCKMAVDDAATRCPHCTSQL